MWSLIPIAGLVYVGARTGACFLVKFCRYNQNDLFYGGHSIQKSISLSTNAGNPTITEAEEPINYNSFSIFFWHYYTIYSYVNLNRLSSNNLQRFKLLWRSNRFPKCCPPYSAAVIRNGWKVFWCHHSPIHQYMNKTQDL